MALFDLHTHHPIHRVSYHTGALWQMLNNRRFITQADFNGVVSGITQLMIGTHNRCTVPGFKARKTWQGLPWEVLWDKTQDEDTARNMMGLMAMHAFIVHPDNWATSTTHYAGHEYPNRYYTKFVILPNGERRYFDEPEEPVHTDVRREL